MQGGVEPDGDDEFGAVCLGQQQSKIFWVAHRGKGHRTDPQVLDPLQPRGEAIRLGGHHDLVGRFEGVGLDLVGVTDDEVRSMPSPTQCVGTGLHTDQYRAVLPDEALERDQVGGVVVASGHHQHLPAAEGDLNIGHAHPINDQSTLLPKELDGVRRKRLELSGQPGFGLDHQVSDRVHRLLDAVSDLGVADVDPALVKPQPAAVLDPQHFRTDPIDQHDARGDEDLRTQIREPTGD